MAHAIMFDTLHFANKLKAAGVPAAQAEVQAETLAEFIDEAEQHIASKADLEKMSIAFRTELHSEIQRVKTELHSEIRSVKTELHSEINQLRSDMNIKIAETKNELIKWVIGMAFGQTTLVFTMLKVLH